MDDEFKQSGLPISALREITLLLNLNHKNVVDLTGVAVGKSLDRCVRTAELMSGFEHDPVRAFSIDGVVNTCVIV